MQIQKLRDDLSKKVAHGMVSSVNQKRIYCDEILPLKHFSRANILLRIFNLQQLNTSQGGELEAKLRDTTWRLQQLQTQYDYLASKSATQNETFKTSEDQIEVS